MKSLKLATPTNRRGFAYVMILALMPALLGLAFALGAGGVVISERREAMSACRSELLKGLEAARGPMKRLLDLNPAAKALEFRTFQLEVAIAEAAASGNGAGVAIATAQLYRVYKQRKALERVQKALYETARLQLWNAQWKAFQGLSASRDFLKIIALPPLPVRPALRPEGPGPAPTWTKEKGFSKAQTLAQRWQWSFDVRGNAKHFLTASHREVETCSATLNDSEDPWFPELR